MFVLEGDRAAPAGEAVGEADGAVDAVDQPAPRATSLVGALLAEDRVARTVGSDEARGGALGGLVGVGDQIGAHALAPGSERCITRLFGGLGCGLGGGDRECRVGLECGCAGKYGCTATRQ